MDETISEPAGQLWLVAAGPAADRGRAGCAGLFPALDRPGALASWAWSCWSSRACRFSPRRCSSPLLSIAVCLVYWKFIRPAAELRDDQPLLNRKGDRMIGRRVTVVDAIVNGRGKVKVGDSVWLVEGSDCPVGTVGRSDRRAMAPRCRLRQRTGALEDPSSDACTSGACIHYNPRLLCRRLP